MDIQYLKNVALYIISAVISLLLIVYIVYQAFGGFESTIETVITEKITERETITLEGYIMRNEEIIYSKTEGGVYYLYKDGEKIGVNTLIANIYSNDQSLNDRNEIMEIDKKKNILEESNIAGNITFLDTTVIDGEINSIYNILRYKIEQGDIDYILYKKDELLKLLNKRAIITRAVPNYNDQIKILEDQKLLLTSKNEDIAESVVSDVSGYFYSSIDGFESEFSSTKVTSLTVSEYKKMINSKPAHTISGSANGYGIGKIVVDYKWYVTCVIANDKLKQFIEKRNYDIIFPYNNDIMINMLLERIIQDPVDDTVILLFSTGTILDGFNFLRKQNIEVVQRSHTGYRVPIISVHMTSDGRYGVYILDGNIVKFKEIEPVIESNGSVIVKVPDILNDEFYYNKLKLYDLIITKGTKLYEGKIID